MIINIGTYDANNFGDLLFPFILDHFIEDDVLHISPTGNHTEWQGTRTTKSFFELEELTKKASAIILGGGHLISTKQTKIKEYSYCDDLNEIIYPSLWIYPTILANKYDIPIIWNALGVQSDANTVYSNIRKLIFENIDYLTVRDDFSANQLNNEKVNHKIIIDTAICISEVFPKDSLYKLFISFLKERNILGERIGVFSIKNRYLDCHIEEAIESIKFISKELEVVPVLIPLGQCHGDEIIIRHLSEKGIHFILGDYSIKIVTALIAHSCFYCGSSLHGFITASSYNVKGVIIADEKKTSFKKFSGHLKFHNLTGYLINSWKKKLKIISLLQYERKFVSISDFGIDDHWKIINRQIHGKKINVNNSIGDLEISKKIVSIYQQ